MREFQLNSLGICNRHLLEPFEFLNEISFIFPLRVPQLELCSPTSVACEIWIYTYLKSKLNWF